MHSSLPRGEVFSYRNALPVPVSLCLPEEEDERGGVQCVSSLPIVLPDREEIFLQPCCLHVTVEKEEGAWEKAMEVLPILPAMSVCPACHATRV